MRLRAFLDRPGAALARWDELLRRRNVAGLAGVDAHGRLFQQDEFLPSFSSYSSLFRVLRTYVVLDSSLSGEAARDAAAVRDALARGRSYMAVEALAPADAFFFHATRGDEAWQMGDTAPPAPDLLLRAGGRLPRGARVALYLDGKRIAVGRDALEFPARTAGTYRVEVSVAGWNVPWILSNPIYVYGAAEAAVRARRAAWPVERPPPALARTLDAFEEGSALAAEIGRGDLGRFRGEGSPASATPAAPPHGSTFASRSPGQSGLPSGAPSSIRRAGTCRATPGSSSTSGLTGCTASGLGSG